MSVSVRTLDRKIIQDAANWAMLQAYLNQKDARIWRVGDTVSMISHGSKTAADEFHRFLVNARGRK